MLKQKAIRIGQSLTPGRVNMTTSIIDIPSEPYRDSEHLTHDIETNNLSPNEFEGAMLHWDNEVTEDGLILSARVSTGMLVFETEAEPNVRLKLNDQQLRALAIDLVKASMIRGIEF
jgi:hypothetical protein